MKKFKYLLIPVVFLAACKPAVNNTAETTALPLSGTWKMISAVTITKDDSVHTYPVKGIEMIKIINNTHFSFFQHDAKGGGAKPVYDSGAGTYTLNGDNYTENLQYCNYREWENRSFNFKISIRHDTLVQKGIEKIDSLKINHEIVETYVKMR